MKNKIQSKFVQIVILSILFSTVAGFLFCQFYVPGPKRTWIPPSIYGGHKITQEDLYSVTYATRDIPEGAILQASWMEPGTLPVNVLPKNALCSGYLGLVGYTVKKNIGKGQMLTQDNVSTHTKTFFTEEQ